MKQFSGTCWEPGDVILTREIHRDAVWMATCEYVVEDTGDRLVTFIPPGAEFGFPDGHPLGEHPWKSRGAQRWTGHGKLTIARFGQPWQVSVFWHGDNRELECWYIDMIRPIQRFSGGIDGTDQELDLVIAPDGTIEEKDVTEFEQEVLDGRFTDAEAATLRADFARVKNLVERDGVPAESHWATWEPPNNWDPLDLPTDWAQFAPLSTW
ncbi:DUF402 domain-containing protein [Rudaeicoccus suwonensis]|uniref:DUF402 domain-containing protein n=1 Tax=Rudaeicoccus suwonensis TaxID=657409 RepID=A0A561E7B4_9MICO|nr:DUF402 domain-containing protein [Rudaeicoccus suwonensis]TWE11450.1 hypothetical protein BKA23_0218 [Rudaeicoccus suwonensis]